MGLGGLEPMYVIKCTTNEVGWMIMKVKVEVGGHDESESERGRMIIKVKVEVC